MRLRTLLVAGTATAALATLVGDAAASIPDSNGHIHGCYLAKSGFLRVIDTDAGQACLKNEVALTWNQAGTQGPPGPSGAPQYTQHVVHFVPPDPHGNGNLPFDETVSCPTSTIVISGGIVSTTAGPEFRAAANGANNPSSGLVSLDPQFSTQWNGWDGTAIDPVTRPSVGPTADRQAWRFSGFVTLANTFDFATSTPTIYPTDLTFYIVCA
jgi:hypothetical protein